MQRLTDVVLPIPTHESLTVEFKSDRKRLPDSELVEAVVCLANANGMIADESDVYGWFTGDFRMHLPKSNRLRPCLCPL